MPNGENTPSPFVRWRWTTDFSRGIRGWMSYPLHQDIGYDPTLYTTDISGRYCLVRNVRSHGQDVLRIGLIKPLSFHVTRQSSFNLRYELKMGGPVKAITLMLASFDGKLYQASLPARPGVDSLRLQGTALGIPEGGATIQALLIEASVLSPVLGSSNRFIIQDLKISAERPEELHLLRPALARSASAGPPVAEYPVEAAGPLVVEGRTRLAVKITVKDAEGKSVPFRQKRLASSGDKVSYEISFQHPLQPGIWHAAVNAAGARNEFQFLVMGRVPAHPRVLLTSRLLQELRSRYASSPSLIALRTKARRLRSSLAYSDYAGRNIALLPRISVFPGLPEYFTLLENYSNSIALNAVEFKLTGSKAALTAARSALMTISSWPTWTPPWFLAHGLHTYYEVGVFSQRVAVGYDLIADQLTHSEKEKVAEAFWQNGIKPTVEEYFSNNRMPIAASNWMANSVGGAIALAVALYGDLPDWNTRLGTALTKLTVAYNRLLGGLFPGDGSEAEPAGYEEFAMQGMSFGIAALHALGIKLLGTERMIQSFWWPRYAEVTPDLVLDTGDFGGQLRALSGFAWEAGHSHDPSLRAFYDTAETGKLLGISRVQHADRSLEAVPGLLDLTCCSQPAPPAPIPPPSRIFARRGSAVLRSGWKPTDTVISIRVGPWFNHEHHDQGTFQVAAFGQKLISEAGYADYYKDPNYPTYFMQASGHNTVLIDDNPFSQPGENGRYWKALANFPHFTAHVLSPDVDYLSAQLETAYGGVLGSFQREFIFLKPDVLIIRDRLRAPSPHRYEWLLHVPVGASTGIQGENAFITVRQASAALTSLGQNDIWTLEKTPLAGDRYTDLDRIRLHQPYELVLDSSKSPVTSFLVGMKFEQSGHAPKALSVVTEPGQEGFLDRGGGWSWVSRPSSGALETGGLLARGQSLGTKKSADEVQAFGAAISSMQRSDKVMLSSSSPIDLSLQSANHARSLYFYTPQETSLQVAAPREPTGVLLDKHLIHPMFRNGMVILKEIGKGEHEVRIRY